MTYAIVKDGAFVGRVAALPRSYGGISGFNTLSDDALADYGFLPLIEVRPDYDPETERLTGPEVVIGADEVTHTYAVEPIAMAEIKAAALGRLAAHRYAQEIAGITVAGIPVRTDRESQALVTGAALSATLDPEYSVRWKSANGGWVTLDAPTILMLATEIRAHVQACFDAEADHAGIIAVLDDAQAVLDHDITIGWPNDPAA